MLKSFAHLICTFASTYEYNRLYRCTSSLSVNLKSEILPASKFSIPASRIR